MAKKANKTVETNASVPEFLAAISDDTMRAGCKVVAKIMEKATKAKPKMWGSSIVGFGSRQYEGRTGVVDWIYVGFSPRKAALTLYIMGGVDRHAALLKKLGKHKAGGSCLYIKRIDDVDTGVLETIVKDAVAFLKKTGK